VGVFACVGHRYARGKTLQSDALKKNKYNTKDSIVHLLEDGKGVMPRLGYTASRAHQWLLSQPDPLARGHHDS